MISYTYSPSEEIARWATEVYIKKNPKLGWWVAFTNPTAGPWKKVVAPGEGGTSVEIYRFIREEERPDLILVNDDFKVILIVEAKDCVGKLIASDQMTKSIRVIREMAEILSQSRNPHWQTRKNYKVLPSFLWMCGNGNDIQKECSLVRKEFLARWDGPKRDVVNIVVSKDKSENLINTFVYKGGVFQNLDFQLS